MKKIALCPLVYLVCIDEISEQKTNLGDSTWVIYMFVMYTLAMFVDVF